MKIERLVLFLNTASLEKVAHSENLPMQYRIQRFFFLALKIENFIRKFLIFLIHVYLLKALIVGTP